MVTCGWCHIIAFKLTQLEAIQSESGNMRRVQETVRLIWLSKSLNKTSHIFLPCMHCLCCGCWKNHTLWSCPNTVIRVDANRNQSSTQWYKLDGQSITQWTRLTAMKSLLFNVDSESVAKPWKYEKQKNVHINTGAQCMGHGIVTPVS